MRQPAAGQGSEHSCPKVQSYPVDMLCVYDGNNPLTYDKLKLIFLTLTCVKLNKNYLNYFCSCPIVLLLLQVKVKPFQKDGTHLIVVVTNVNINCSTAKELLWF